MLILLRHIYSGHKFRPCTIIWTAPAADASVSQTICHIEINTCSQKIQPNIKIQPINDWRNGLLNRNFRAIGLSVIFASRDRFTSSSYFADPSRDREGRHLCDLCDICIDNHVPHGDAVIPVDGEVKAGPVSSIVGFYIVNSMMLAACEELDRRGIKPPVFKSGNVSGGDRYNAEMVEKYLPRVRHL